MTYINLKVAAEVANYPAYKVVRREVSKGHYQDGVRHDVEFTDIVAFEKICLERKGYYQEFEPGSVVSYYLKNGDDPVAGIDRARRLKHPLHWINSCATVITSHKRVQETMTLVEIGMVVRFEGILFTIAKAPNNNLALIPLKLNVT